MYMGGHNQMGIHKQLCMHVCMCASVCEGLGPTLAVIPDYHLSHFATGLLTSLEFTEATRLASQ